MENGKDQLLVGMDVFDEQGTKVGKVVKYDAALGYFETLGTFSGPRYIPALAIERIGPSGTYLNVPKSIVSLVYKHLPMVKPDVTPGGQLTGGATADSGYTGRPVPLNAAELNEIRKRIDIGTTVLDSEDKKLGTIEAYDSDTGYMRIEKDGLTIKDFFLPVTSVSYLDDRGIHLLEAKDRITNRFSRLPEVAREFFAA